MMIRRSTASGLVCTVAACLFLALSQTAFAAAIAAGPPDQPTDTFLVYNENPLGTIDVGSVAEPLVIDYDPSAGPIDKAFNINTDRDGVPGVSLGDLNLFLLNAGQPLLTVHEHLEVGPGSPPWTDWHEEILTPNWEWVNVGISVPTATIDNHGTAVWFDFPPQPPGTPIDIWKDLVYTGNGSEPNFNTDFFSGTLTVHVIEYPTIPEPATIGLAAIALVLLVGRRRSRR